MSLSSLFVVTNALRLTRFEKKKEEKEENMQMKYTLCIDGMMCQHCVAHVQKALTGVEGILSVEVNLKKKTAVIETSGDDKQILAQAEKAVTEAGYTVKKIK